MLFFILILGEVVVMRKFLFFDIDGVVVIDNMLSAKCVNNVRRLISLVPNLEVVLTSTRRADERQCEQIKDLLGVSYLQRTPVSHKSSRSEEIKEFLVKIPEPYSFAIVDDDINLYKYYFRELIICNKYQGFTEDVAYALYGVLQNNSVIK